ncbi:MAG: NTP pyrophosphohydrolase [Myxococcota bacterium]
MTLVVDGANVVGSVPDGWWRDRAGAARRLRDRLAAGVAGFEGAEVVLVVEGAAVGIGSVDGVRVVGAPGSGDDAVVDEVRDGTDCVVVTADRGLAARVRALGARVVGPSAVRRTGP